jgi:lipoate-protein ligase A
MIQSVYAHVTTLEQLGVTTDFEKVSKHLRQGFEKEFKIDHSKIEEPVLTSEEQNTMNLLSKERYSSLEWTNTKKETNLIKFN